MGRSAILLIGHGSRREASNRQLGCLERLVQHQAGPQVIVRRAHMELASPTIVEGFSACVAAGADLVIAHPYMLFAGRHAVEHIPALVAAAARNHPEVAWRVSEPLGVDPRLGEVVLERCGISAARAVAAGCDGSCDGVPSRCERPWCRQ